MAVCRYKYETVKYAGMKTTHENKVVATEMNINQDSLKLLGKLLVMNPTQAHSSIMMAL